MTELPDNLMTPVYFENWQGADKNSSPSHFYNDLGEINDDAAYSFQPLRLQNTNSLPVVETLYSVDAVNDAIASGYSCIVKPIKQNPELKLKSLLLRNRNTGEFCQVPSRLVHQQYSREPKIYSEEVWDEIGTVTGYARTRLEGNGWAAYKLPKNLEVGSRVYIRDLIEDIIAEGFMYGIAAAVDAEAVWNGASLEIDRGIYDRFQKIG